MSFTRLTDLARAVLANAEKIENYLNSHDLPLPSFDEHSSPELPIPGELQKVRQQAVDSAMELQDLLIGPVMQLRPVLNATSLHAIYKFDIPSKVPLDGEISFKELAEKSDLSEPDVRKILRFAMAFHRVFQEKRPGFVSHTAASRLLAEDESAMAGLGFMFDECYQSFAHTVEALQKRKGTGPDESGWSFANGKQKAMWDYHTEHPELGQRAGLAMASFTKGFNHDISALTEDYDWTSVGGGNGVLVDLGGADGTIAMAIARAHKGMRCVVQEIPELVARTNYQVPADLTGRIEFVAHDFFQPQPTVADVYLFRQIFHNWGDAYGVKILQALIPALKPGAKVLINDAIVPPPGTLPPMHERGVRSIDMIVLSLFNSREREQQDWEALFAEADPRFGHIKISQPEGSHLGLVEATWIG